MRFRIVVIVSPDVPDIIQAVEQLMEPYNHARIVDPYHVDLTDEDMQLVAQRYKVPLESPLFPDKIRELYGYSLYQDEYGYHFMGTDNPHGYWDWWSFSVETDVYNLPDTSPANSDPLVVVTPGGVWHTMPYRWDGAVQQAAERNHMVQQLLGQFSGFRAALLECHS